MTMGQSVGSNVKVPLRKNSFWVAEGERKCKISNEDILYIEVVGHDMFFHTKDKVIQNTESLF